MKKIVLFIAICVGLPFVLVRCLESASAQSGITVEDAFSYPSLGTMNMGVAFMNITNHGKEDAVIAASTPAATRVELHDHIHENGVMKMREVKEIPLPVNKTVALKSGGLHVMLFELTQPLKEGDTFPLTLKLKSGSEIKTTVKVEDRE